MVPKPNPEKNVSNDPSAAIMDMRSMSKVIGNGSVHNYTE